MAPTASIKPSPSALEVFCVAVYADKNLALKYVCCGGYSSYGELLFK